MFTELCIILEVKIYDTSIMLEVKICKFMFTELCIYVRIKDSFFWRDRWPSDEMVNSITALHPEMTSKKIKLWFEDRRKMDPQHKAWSNRR